jgi:hypothetical protein
MAVSWGISLLRRGNVQRIELGFRNEREKEMNLFLSLISKAEFDPLRIPPPDERYPPMTRPS